MLRTWCTLAVVAALMVAACSDSTVIANTWTPGRHEASFDVDGIERTAVVVVPDDLSRPVPIAFVFHGHGGSGASVDRRLDIDGLWPAAIVVYPDGLVGHRGLTDPEGQRTGWQTVPGEAGDRDLAFFDAMLSTLSGALPVDFDRIFLAGHSNGSQFASLVLNQRGDRIAAIANLSVAPAAGMIATDPVRPMFIALGTADPIVPFARQQQLIPLVEDHLDVDPARATVNGYLRAEPGIGNTELVTFIHPGGHEVPPEVSALVVEFFKRHALSGG